jgi:glutaredoxin
MLEDVENPVDASRTAGLGENVVSFSPAEADAAGEEATALLEPRIPDNDDDDPTKTTTQHLDNHIIMVHNLDEYQGDSLRDKVDDFINKHAVVMFSSNSKARGKNSQSSSDEVKDLLGTQIGVDVYCMDLDVHLQGEEIFQYISAKNNSNSKNDDNINDPYSKLPLIYIKGKFVGGNEDIKSLHATGQLENVYLKGLIGPSAASAAAAAALASSSPRQRHLISADMEQQKSRSSSSSRAVNPPFWFPNTVNNNVMRGVAFQVFVLSAISVAFHFKPWGYVFRLFRGP